MRSPNHGERRGGATPSLVVLHYTAMQSAEAASRALCDPAREVSAHYLISEAGELWSLVDEERRAWHAGQGSWRGASDVNSRSIGIELANPGNVPFAAPLMDRLEELLADILARWQLPPEAVIGHSDMAPGRKIDPGPRFDWHRLARGGLSIWPEPDHEAAHVDADKFARDCRAFGWPALDEALQLTTLRLRFRPQAKGPLDATDCAIAADLARRFSGDD
ncbi:MAG: N-acetylmuramoyl-L-alanine amidase [Pseudomonadota bacterium]